MRENEDFLRTIGATRTHVLKIKKKQLKKEGLENLTLARRVKKQVNEREYKIVW